MWKYCQLAVNINTPYAEILDEYGKGGWECYQVLNNPTSEGDVIFFFKREIVIL